MFWHLNLCKPHSIRGVNAFSVSASHGCARVQITNTPLLICKERISDNDRRESPGESWFNRFIQVGLTFVSSESSSLPVIFI